MRKIRIGHLANGEKKSVFTRRRAYSFYIGNGKTVRFTNGRQAETFMNEVNKDLNFNLIMFNQIYGEIFVQYRKLWFYMDFENESFDNNRKITGNFALIEKSMEFMMTRGEFENGSTYVFNGFNQIIEYLSEIIETLILVEQSRIGFVEVKMLRLTNDKLLAIKRELAAIGEDRGNVSKTEGYIMEK
jgi:hypothetical protein